jgi:hypothetical protein
MRGMPPEIIKVTEDKADAPAGFNIKIRHLYKTNGHPCSINKSAACNVTRTNDGWLYYCHRCNAQGYISSGSAGPTSVKKAIDRLVEPKSQVIPAMSLPGDFTHMRGKRKDNIPWAAYNWLWGNGLNEDDIKKHRIGWSNVFQRVIFPCFATGWMIESNVKARKLIGWIGREVRYKNKKDRPKNVPKYLSKRTEGIKWLHYHVPTKSTENVVLVEDCVSAIRVANAMRWHGLAMLTTHIPTRLLLSLKGMNVWVWLDADAMAQAVKKTQQLKAIGLNAKFVSTPLDPKHYDNLEIHKILSTEGGMYRD